MKVNWLVRLKNRTFWISLVPALLIVVQVAASLFGVTWNLGDMGNKILTLVNAVFSVLILLGVINDPTTEGVHDSADAMNYKEPKLRGE